MIKGFVLNFLLLTLVVSGATAETRIQEVSSFAYQLQNIDLNALQSSAVDLLIIDYSLEGDDDTAFTSTEVDMLKQQHTVLSYLSIGEAEDYRFYFKSRWTKNSQGRVCDTRLTEHAPGWLDFPNENWCGNYKVRFWNKKWRKKIFGITSGKRKSYLDRIIDAGFDGVYLDIIDGYEYWKYDVKKKRRRKRAARDMALLVIRLADYAREVRGVTGFIVVPQNGAGILTELSDELKARYLEAVDAIGAEDTYFYGDEDDNNPYVPQESAIQNLSTFLEAGKLVLATDYLTEQEKVTQFRDDACNSGFIPQVATRALDDLSVQKLLGCQ